MAEDENPVEPTPSPSENEQQQEHQRPHRRLRARELRKDIANNNAGFSGYLINEEIHYIPPRTPRPEPPQKEEGED